MLYDDRECNKQYGIGVKVIVQETIDRIYPKYYPVGAVDFFKAHHNDNNIRGDIKSENVFLLYENDMAVGTITIKKNSILRLFVLPEYQHRGYGSALLDFAEKVISNEYTEAIVDASLPVKRIYLERGYVDREYHIIKTDNGDYLCYDVMTKRL